VHADRQSLNEQPTRPHASSRRARYPGSVTYDIRRIRGAGEIWAAELTVHYDGGEPRYGVDLLEIRNGKIAHETIYVGEPFDAPEWRAQWRVAP
jgi:hypothetical protein